tara:strand:+ start:564 stop:1160 length:597 start_codon:yes stop_codon:yes gene_type:complete
MLNKVKLYGELAEFVGHKELEAVINSPADAIRFLLCNFPGLEAHMADRHYKVLTNTYEISEEEIHYPIGKSDISIVPVITGAGGVGRTLAGVALIGLALVMPGGGFAAFKAGTAKFFASTAMNLGIGLTLMGVSELLFPLPKPKEFSNEEDPRISFSFSGVQNTSRAGTSIPLCYGEIVTGSVVISAGIDTHQVVAED